MTAREYEPEGMGRLISGRSAQLRRLPFPEGDAETDNGMRGALGDATVLSPATRCVHPACSGAPGRAAGDTERAPAVAVTPCRTPWREGLGMPREGLRGPREGFRMPLIACAFYDDL